MRLPIADAVEAEIAEAFDYYQSQSLGLGLRMAAEVRAAIHKILAYPDAQTRLDAKHRRRIS